MEPRKKDNIYNSKGSRTVVDQTRRLKADAAASAEELRQFIAKMHGKSPQEVLGAVAESGLTRGIITSAIGAFVILVVFTVGPFMLNKLSADTAPASTKNPQQTAAKTEPNSTRTAVQKQSTEPEVVPERADLEKATDAMGIGETKTADPDENPLDNKLDSLLDGID